MVYESSGVCVCVSYSMFVENYRDLIDKDMGGASPRRVGRADSTPPSSVSAQEVPVCLAFYW